MKINPREHVDIIDAYTVDLWPLGEIAEKYGVTRACVHKILRKHGVDTSKHQIEVSCTVCGKIILRTRRRLRRNKNHFCDTDCYASYLQAGKGNSVMHRHSQRLARAVVAQYFDSLQPQHVVHHEDRNNYNNTLENLRVFACAGDHLRYHHQHRDEQFDPPKTFFERARREAWERENKAAAMSVEPVWDGRYA